MAFQMLDMSVRGGLDLFNKINLIFNLKYIFLVSANLHKFLFFAFYFLLGSMFW